MNTTKETFSEAVHKKAGELKIIPKLLLVAIGSIAEDDHVKGSTILIRFGKELCIDMKQAAFKQIESRSEKKKAAGENALKDLDPQTASIGNLAYTVGDSDFMKATDLLQEGEQLKLFHLIAYNQVLSQMLKIKKYVSKANSLDIVDIIKYLCPELIERCRGLGVIMEKDFNYN